MNKEQRAAYVWQQFKNRQPLKTSYAGRYEVWGDVYPSATVLVHVTEASRPPFECTVQNPDKLSPGNMLALVKKLLPEKLHEQIQPAQLRYRRLSDITATFPEDKYPDRYEFSLKDVPSHEVVAVRLANGVVYGNGAILTSIKGSGQTSNSSRAHIQELMEQDGIPLIPFQLILGSDNIPEPENHRGRVLLPFHLLEVVEQTGPEVFEDVVRLVPRYSRSERVPTKKFHFLGASLFRVKGLFQSKTWLLDVDRIEINHPTEKLVNQFLVEIPEACSTIAHAYKLLKPQEVRDWEETHQKPALRQGEFFFLPEHHPVYSDEGLSPEDSLWAFVEFPYEIREVLRKIRQEQAEESSVDLLTRVKRKLYTTKRQPLLFLEWFLQQPFERQATITALVGKVDRYSKAFKKASGTRAWDKIQLGRGSGSSHRVDEMFLEAETDTAWVKGTVVHNNGEHNPLVLEDWHRVIPNTAAGKAFKVSGAVD